MFPNDQEVADYLAGRLPPARSAELDATLDDPDSPLRKALGDRAAAVRRRRWIGAGAAFNLATLVPTVPLETRRPGRRTGWPAVGLAAGVLVAVGGWWVGVRKHDSGQEVVRREPASVTGPWEPGPTAKMNADGAVHDSQEFKVRLHIPEERAKAAASVFRIDAEGVYHLGDVRRPSAGPTEAVLTGRFGTTPGWELCVVVQSYDPAVVRDLPSWILPADRDALQEAAAADRKDLVGDIIHTALRTFSTWAGSPDDIRLTGRIRHN